LNDPGIALVTAADDEAMLGRVFEATSLLLLVTRLSASAQQDVGVGAPALRVRVDDGGKPFDLSRYSMCVELIDEQGMPSFPEFSEARPGVGEISALEPGPYWLVVQVPYYDRIVRTLTVRADATTEERVALAPEKQARAFRGAITIMGGPDGKLSWSDDAPTGKVALSLCPVSPSSVSLATEVVVCAREGLMDGMTNEFPAGPIDFTLASRGAGRLLMRARGFAPAAIELDFTRDAELDLGSFVLQPARRVRARLVVPEGFEPKGVGWGYAARAEFATTGHLWWQRTEGIEAELELGGEPFVLGAEAWNRKSNWASPLVVVDPRADDPELVLTLQKKVSLVLEPSAVHDMQELEVLDSAGLLVWRREEFVDVPLLLMLIPGTYALRHRAQWSQAEFVAQPVTVGTVPQRLTLER